MGHEPPFRGIVTNLLRRFSTPALSPELQDMATAFAPTNAMADAFGWPKTWLTCAHCGEWSWVLPPHALEPCPLVVEAAQTQGLKMDAERSMALRAGINFEKQAQAFAEFMETMRRDEDDE